uniref:Uncharacterized protein n=1 Tax=Leersia perrieri TaxID=77586 RepID=A0A0D9VZF8_9ORYZ
MAGMVGVWFGEFAKMGREAAAAAAEAGVSRRGQSEGKSKGGDVHQESTRRRRDDYESSVLSDSEATICMLMDRFAPA